MELYSVCQHCNVIIHRARHARQWYSLIGNSVKCAISPIGKHQWNGSYTQ